MSDRLTEIKEQLAEAKRGAVFPSCERDDTDKRWLVAEVARLRSVETDFHQLSDVAGWHHGETQIALARAKQAESDLAALRQRPCPCCGACPEDYPGACPEDYPEAKKDWRGP
jgi:hypothetical protein